MTRRRKNAVTEYPKVESGDDNLDLEEILYLNSSKNYKTGCINWTAGLGTRGYGQFSWKGTKYYTHRLSYTLNKGPIPPHQYVCHECDNPLCINPDHLFIGTPLDNVEDRELKERTHRPEGSYNTQSKLTEAEVLEIRRLWRTGNYYQHELAERYNVTRDAIQKVVTYKRWKHLP